MRRLLRKYIYFIFWAIVLLGLVGILFNITLLDFISKPLLMPLLMLAVHLRSSNTRGKTKIQGALLLSFFGDILLMFEDKGTWFFISGLACFLFAHVMYIAYFRQLSRNNDSLIKDYPYITIGIIGYAGLLLALLYPVLGDLRVPVIIYACIISIMLFYAFKVPYKVSRFVRYLFISGAIFFVLSDSLLAINKFYLPFAAAGFLIRITYCLAQFFIAKGYIKKKY